MLELPRRQSMLEHHIDLGGRPLFHLGNEGPSDHKGYRVECRDDEAGFRLQIPFVDIVHIRKTDPDLLLAPIA